MINLTTRILNDGVFTDRWVRVGSTPALFYGATSFKSPDRLTWQWFFVAGVLLSPSRQIQGSRPTSISATTTSFTSGVSSANYPRDTWLRYATHQTNPYPTPGIEVRFLSCQSRGLATIPTELHRPPAARGAHLCIIYVTHNTKTQYLGNARDAFFSNSAS